MTRTRTRSRLHGSGLASRAFYALGRFIVVDLVARLWNRMRLEGTEHVPATGAFILAPVHRSNMDTPYAGAATRRRRTSRWRTSRRPAGWTPTG